MMPSTSTSTCEFHSRTFRTHYTLLSRIIHLHSLPIFALPSDQYAQVEEMLESLGFPELLEKFKNAMFKVILFVHDLLCASSSHRQCPTHGSLHYRTQCYWSVRMNS